MAKNKKVFQGEFYTPKSLSKFSNEKIDIYLGENWREKYVVWDCAAGHGALTEDGEYRDLYQSTLEQSDLDDMIDEDINPEATKFQFDFINGDINDIPDSLMDSIKNGEDILFFINPPYAKAKGKIDNTSGVGDNTLKGKMIANSLASASIQLYCQFLFRIIDIKREYNANISIALFSPSLFMTAWTFAKFKEYFESEFEYRYGFLCNSIEFDCREPWGIAFTIWNPGCKVLDNHSVEVVETNELGEVVKLFDKELYSVPKKETANNWIKTEAKKMKVLDNPRLRNPVTVVDDKKNGKGCEGFKGFMYMHGNSVLYNEKDVLIMSSSYNSVSSGFQILEENFRKSCAYFMARKVIDRTWHGEKDEYMVPDLKNEMYKNWEDNSLLYSCFNNSSNQSALRDVAYKNKSWDIINEFFWIPVDEVKEMAEEIGYVEMLLDIEKFGSERQMSKEIKDLYFDPELESIRKDINDLFKESIERRRWFSKNNPQLHLDCWDAGYYQLKQFWKKEFPEEFDKIKKAYREYSVSLVDKVYQLGYLKR
jgi:hypothetical protein